MNALMSMVAAVSLMGVGAALARPERILRTEAVIDATPAQLWEAYTTKAGWESWAVPLAEVDFRVGGTIRTTYNKEEGIGGPGTITHHILAYEPERVVVTKFDAPANAVWAKKAEGCQVIVRLEPVSATKTRFVETMVGWGEGPDWDEAYEKFKGGNAWTMEQLKKKFGGDAAAAEKEAGAVLGLIGSMVGGEWVHEHKDEQGRAFRARQVFEAAPDGKGVLGRGWLGGDTGMFYHGLMQVWREGSGVMFQDLDQDGAVARGAIRQSGEHQVTWDWAEQGEKGERYAVVMAYDGTDAYTMTLKTGDGKELVRLPMRRVPRAGPEFLKMKPGSTGPAASKEPDMSIDTSLFPASGPVENGLVKEVTIKASPRQAFDSWVTSEGIKGFLQADSKIELRIGGAYEIYFGGADVPEADRGSNGCQVLSYIPGEMLSFSWNAPPKFPIQRAQWAWVVLTFAAAGPGETKVRLVHTGFGKDGQWPQVREYFDAAWGRVLGAMKEHYEK